MDIKQKIKGLPTWLKVAGGCVAAFIVGIFLLVAIIFIFAFNMTAGPTEAGEEFLELGAADSYDAMYELTAPTLQSVTKKPQLIRIFEDYSVLGEMTEVSFTNRSVDGGLAIIYGTIESATEVSPIYMELENVGDDWLVSYFSLNEDDIPVE